MAILDKLVEDNSASIRKIPRVKFYEDIATLVGESVEEIEEVMRPYQELHSKYTLMGQSLISQLETLRARIKSLRQAQEVVLTAEKREGEAPISLFNVNECVYGQAQVTDPKKVWLWLGSNTLMEYDLEEANEVLTSNIAKTDESILDLIRDIKYVREQVTVIEVAISRLHNYRVELRNSQKK